MNKYKLYFYTKSDGKASEEIEAENPKQAEEKLLAIPWLCVDYVYDCQVIKPREIAEPGICPACGKVLADCDCIPF